MRAPIDAVALFWRACSTRESNLIAVFETPTDSDILTKKFYLTDA